MSAKDVLEHTEHIAHAGHGHGDHGGHGAEAKSNLGTYVGITMAVLGVLLAFCAAKVGGERTELVQTLVSQSNAQAQYNAQDVKHRVAYLSLQQVHATTFGANPGALSRQDVLSMAHTVERYLEESHLAKTWSESYQPAVEAHVEAQERYETSQLAAEIGIVIASVALLIRKRVAWFASLALGLVSIANVATTYAHTHAAVHASEHHIEESGQEYRDARVRDRTTAAEAALIESMVEWAGTPVNAAHEAPAPAAAPEGAAHEAPAPAAAPEGAAHEAH